MKLLYDNRLLPFLIAVGNEIAKSNLMNSYRRKKHTVLINLNAMIEQYAAK